MTKGRIEKKFVYQEGDDSYKFFLINGMFKKLYPDRIINSLYFDTDDLKNVWDNINGFSDRLKIRLRWYGSPKKLIEPILEIKSKRGYETKKDSFKISKLNNFNY